MQQSQSDSQRFDQSGNISDNEGGVSTSGTFSLDETDTEEVKTGQNYLIK
jgi:hypothetical protein